LRCSRSERSQEGAVGVAPWERVYPRCALGAPGRFTSVGAPLQGANYYLFCFRWFRSFLAAPTGYFRAPLRGEETAICLGRASGARKPRSTTSGAPPERGSRDLLPRARLRSEEAAIYYLGRASGARKPRSASGATGVGRLRGAEYRQRRGFLDARRANFSLNEPIPFFGPFVSRHTRRWRRRARV